MATESDGREQRAGKPGKPGGRPPGRRPGPGGPGPGGAGSRPPHRRGRQGGARKGHSARPGSIRLASIGGDRFELVHPSCVRETELDYEEGLEIWKAGDPEGARDALRYALAACRDNMWIHVALGRIALEEFRDPALARGHFGYAVELGRRALPPQFAGRLPVDRPANRPFHDALEGLIASLEALGRRDDSVALRTLKEGLSGARRPGSDAVSGRPDPGV